MTYSPRYPSSFIIHPSRCPRPRRGDRDQTLRVARSTATAGKIFVGLPHFCRLAFSVHELRHVAGQIVLIALAPRQQIDARRQAVDVDVRICGRVAPRVGDAKQRKLETPPRFRTAS
jgi:hypothetical protein